MALSLLDQVESLLAGPRPLPITTCGDPVLRRRCEPYDGSLPGDVFAALVTAMRQSMLAAPGVGLAAPQIGLGIQLAVIEDTASVSAELASARRRVPVPFRVLVNPSYSPVGDPVAAFYEGCLSVPGYQAVVERPETLWLRGWNADGRPIDELVTGWPARIVAHETDHLAGRLYLDVALMRSLSSNQHYLAHWAGPTPQAARVALGF